jgi:hypothetical protein
VFSFSQPATASAIRPFHALDGRISTFLLASRIFILTFQPDNMWGWFGGAAAQARKDAPKKAILQLRSQLDMLKKREKHLENQMAEQDAIARKNISTNKTGKQITMSAIRLG